MMLRSLNFWLFLVALVCGISFWVASGAPLPGGLKIQTPEIVPTENWTDSATEGPVHLRILNGTQISGLARQFSMLVADKGCVVEGVGNADGQWPHSVLINRRLPGDEAKKLAKQFGNLQVVRQWDARLTEDAVLILGDDAEELKKVLAP